MPDAPPRWLPAASLAALAALYLGTLCPTLLGGDNPEFATLFAVGGVAHPSGYPAYVLWLRALSPLPFPTPAYGAAFATALHALGAAAMLYHAARWWGATAWGALLAAALYATAPLSWDLATHAEVFSLNALVAAAILGLSAPDAPVRGGLRCALLGLVAGVGLANHLSCGLLFPLGFAGLWQGSREAPRPALALGLAVAAALPGLSLYLGLLWTHRGPDDPMSWGDTRDLRGLLAHVLRSDYGSTSLAANRGPPRPGPELLALSASLARTLRWVGVPLAVTGAVTALRGARRTAALSLLAAVAVAGPLFIARFNIPPVGVGAAVVARFHLLPAALLVPLVALGFDALSRRLPLRPLPRLVATLGAMAACALGAYPSVAAEQGPEVERSVLDALDTAAPRAVVLGVSDDLTFGFPYAQRALGRRGDVLFVNPSLLLLEPYRRRVERSLGASLSAVSRARNVDTAALASVVLGLGRPLYLAEAASPVITRSFPSYPDGLLVRVLPRGSAAPTLREVLGANERRFAAYRQQPAAEAPTTPWLRNARERYARPWLTLADAVRSAGRPDIAERLRVRASMYAPWFGRTP